MVRQVVEAGAIPIILGGDHSIVEPDVRAVAAGNGPLGLVHFDTHTDTGTEVFGVEPSHGTPMWALVEAGHVDRELGIDEVVRRAVQVVGDGPVYLSVDVGPGPGLCAGYGHARTGRDDEVSSCGRAGTWRGRSSSWAPR
jgi:arginase family enzyme